MKARLEKSLESLPEICNFVCYAMVHYRKLIHSNGDCFPEVVSPNLLHPLQDGNSDVQFVTLQGGGL
jgi:hypothetical protein